MGDQTEFKHIKVSSDVDDNIIYAGSSSSNASKPDGVSFGATVIQETPGQLSEADTGISVDDLAMQSASRPHVNSEAAKATQEHDDYHATTLADIEESKMPKAQIITIALALIAIAAFIIWYILAM